MLSLDTHAPSYVNLFFRDASIARHAEAASIGLGSRETWDHPQTAERKRGGALDTGQQCRGEVMSFHARFSVRNQKLIVFVARHSRQ